VNKDFGITGNTADLQYLTQAVLGGKISQRNLLVRTASAAACSTTFDPEVEGGAHRNRGARTRRRTG
jgi:hypothetical protein